MKLLTTLATLTAALLLCFSGAFAYVWYQTNNTVDQAIKAIAPFARISYGSIISSVYPGKLGLADVTILLEGRRLHAEAITISAATIFDLYALQKNPSLFLVKHPRLKIRGLRSPLRADQFKLLARPFNHPYLKTLTTLDAVGCGNRDEIGDEDMTTMGYGARITDIELWSGPQQFGPSYAFTLSAKIRGVADHAMSIHFDDAPSSLSRALQRLERLDVDSIVLRTRDRGYNPRRLKFCAEQLGMSVASYQRHHLAALKHHLKQRSIIAGPAMLQSYEEGLHRSARMRLKIQPQPDFAIDDLGFYQAEDYPELLGIAFSVNNRPPGKTKKVQLATTQATPEPSPPAGAGKPINAVDIAPSLAWPDLQQALYQQLLVTTQSGGQHRGRLENVEQDLLTLSKNMGAGSMTYTIDRRRFKHATYYADTGRRLQKRLR